MRNQVQQRLNKVSNLQAEVAMSNSGGDIKVFNPVVIAVVQAIVVTGT